MPKKLFIQTYGCQMNQYDSEKIAQVLAPERLCSNRPHRCADVILLNTCSVRDKAEQKVYSALGSWKEFKDYRDGVIIGVGGCVAQQEGENLLKRVPHLDLVFGTHNIHKLPEMVEQVENERARPVETAFYRDPAYMDEVECGRKSMGQSLCDDHAGLQQSVQLLHRAPCARPRSQPAQRQNYR